MSLSWKMLIEFNCPNCGFAFYSRKDDPHFCSRACALKYRGCSSATKQKLANSAEKQWKENKPRMLEALSTRDMTRASQHSKALWQNLEFRAKIKTARKLRGYTRKPDTAVRRKLRSAAKSAIHRCLRRRAIKLEGTFSILGYTDRELKEHLEKLFTPGMTWNNYGTWEIDHKKPIASFAFDTPIHVINALSNLQPLWKPDNRKKSWVQ